MGWRPRWREPRAWTSRSRTLTAADLLPCWISGGNQTFRNHTILTRSATCPASATVNIGVTSSSNPQPGSCYLTPQARAPPPHTHRLHTWSATPRAHLRRPGPIHTSLGPDRHRLPAGCSHRSTVLHPPSICRRFFESSGTGACSIPTATVSTAVAEAAASSATIPGAAPAGPAVPRACRSTAARARGGAASRTPA